ncbi:hypothetical protein K0M31_001860 [Melipona bicolor]|uniref:Uncharacterized protein n=1 Tax=Melipona bicolor TaxID=60889 RepID=A0AA40GGH4_9HYME|nr:hypothetical protein K0M31_001860 [Melipona bicolor]
MCVCRLSWCWSGFVVLWKVSEKRRFVSESSPDLSSVGLMMATPTPDVFLVVRGSKAVPEKWSPILELTGPHSACFTMKLMIAIDP